MVCALDPLPILQKTIGVLEDSPVTFDDLLSQLPLRETQQIIQKSLLLPPQEAREVEELLTRFLLVLRSYHEGPLTQYQEELPLWRHEKLDIALVWGLYHQKLSLEEFSTACLVRSTWRVDKVWQTYRYMPLFDKEGNPTPWARDYLLHSCSLPFYNLTSLQSADATPAVDPSATLLTSLPEAPQEIFQKLKLSSPSEWRVLVRNISAEETGVIQDFCKGFHFDPLVHTHPPRSCSLQGTLMEDIIPSKALIDAFVKVTQLAIDRHFQRDCSQSFPLCPVIGASPDHFPLFSLMKNCHLQPLSIPLYPLVKQLPDNPDESKAPLETDFSRHDSLHGILRLFVTRETKEHIFHILYPTLEQRKAASKDPSDKMQRFLIDMELNSRTTQGQLAEIARQQEIILNGSTLYRS